MWGKLCEVLLDFEFLQAKIGAFTNRIEQSPAPATVYDLLRDYQNALAALPTDHPLQKQVAALYRTIDANSHVLRDDPTLLIQQAYNALVWEWDEATALGWKVRDATRGYARMWFRQHNPLVTDRALLRTLTGHSGGVISVALSADGQTVASGSWDQSVKLWDWRTGKLLAWMPCQDTVLALWRSSDLRELRAADAGGAAHLPNVYILEVVGR
jgi:hypothetical protein